LAPGATLDELTPPLRAAVAASVDSAGVDPPRCVALSMSPHTVWWEHGGARGGTEDEPSSGEGEEGFRSGGVLQPEARFNSPPRVGLTSGPGAGAASPGAGDACCEFTDPLRRQTPAHEGQGPAAIDSSDPAAAAALEQGAAAADGGGGAVSHWLAGLHLYDCQRIFLSMACRNPRKQLMCEPPSIKRIDYYCRRCLLGGT
jgi:hypothetical protein